MSARERQTRCKKGVCQLLRGRPTAQPGAPLQPGIPGGAKAAAGLVRGLVFRAEARAQLSARFATRLRGSGRPLPLVGDRIEPEANDKIRRMTPVGVFFICQNEDKCHFVNSTNLSRFHCLRPLDVSLLLSSRVLQFNTLVSTIADTINTLHKIDINCGSRSLRTCFLG